MSVSKAMITNKDGPTQEYLNLPVLASPKEKQENRITSSDTT